jgi:hypothetical protein
MAGFEDYRPLPHASTLLHSLARSDSQRREDARGHRTRFITLLIIQAEPSVTARAESYLAPDARATNQMLRVCLIPLLILGSMKTTAMCWLASRSEDPGQAFGTPFQRHATTFSVLVPADCRSETAMIRQRHQREQRCWFTVHLHEICIEYFGSCTNSAVVNVSAVEFT